MPNKHSGAPTEAPPNPPYSREQPPELLWIVASEILRDFWSAYDELIETRAGERHKLAVRRCCMLARRLRAAPEEFDVVPPEIWLWLAWAFESAADRIHAFDQDTQNYQSSLRERSDQVRRQAEVKP